MAERFNAFDRLGDNDGDPRLIAESTGFLGEGNSLYDLR